MLRPYKRKGLGGGFRAENALEAGTGELDAHELFAFALGVGHMHDAAASGEVCIVVSGAREAVDTP